MAKTSQPKKNKPRLTKAELSKEIEAKPGTFSGLSVDAFLLLDENLNLLSINDAGQRLFDVSAEAALGKCIMDVMPDIKKSDIYNKYRHILKTGEPLVIHQEVGDRSLTVQVFKLGDSLGIIVSDITGRKKAEEALRESEEKYRNLFNNAQVGLFRSRIADGKILECNDLIAKMFGYQNCEEFIASHITAEHYVDPNVRDQELAQMLEKGKVENLEALVTRQDGSPFWISYSATIYPKRDYIEGVAIDITERKKAEEMLRVAEERFYKAFRASPDAITISRMADGTLFEVNDMWEKTLGYSRAESVGTNTVALGIWSDPAIRQKCVKQLQKTGSLRNFETDLRCKTGELYQVSLSSERLEIEGEQCLLTIIHDITERKRAEEALRKSIQLLNDTGEMAKVGGWELDLATKEVSWTEEVARIHGVGPRYKMSLEEAINFYAPESIPVLEATLKKTAETGEPYDLESLFIPSGSKDKIWVRSLGRAIYSGGKIVKLAGTFQNIDKYKRAEEELGASLKEKEALLSEVHHRVKNNFQLITSLLDMVGMRARNEETIRVCASVHARVYAMGLVHSQLYQSGSFAQIDMEAHVKELVGYLAQVYATNVRRITPVIDAPGVYLSITQAVPCALVLNEVISNAFRHAFQGRQKGTIEVSLRKLAEGMVTIRIKDDGIGMPDDFDIDKASTLGLKLTRNLVQEQLKGSIQFRRGNGTDVTIEFKVG